MLRHGEGSVRDQAPTLIGRQEALDRLDSAIAPPYDGARVVLVEGPAGIGKTTLVWAGLASAESQGAVSLRASPLEAEVSYAFATVRDLFEAQLPALAGLAPDFHLTALRRAMDARTGGSLAADGQEVGAQQIGVALLAVLRALALQAPTIVAIDDFGWVDRSSREALTYALRRLPDLPIRVVLAQRSPAPGTPVPFGLDDPARPVPIVRIWLEPLSLGALQSVLQDRTGTTFARPTLLRIHEVSAGNPFYAIELARALAAQGAVLRPGEMLPVPATLSELVADRLQRQSSATRRLLLTAAMSSRPTLELLRLRVGREPMPTLRPAVSAGLVTVERGVVKFCHPLYASTLVTGATNNERRATHAWLGEAEEDAEARARHLALASTGVDEDVAHKLADAAMRARQRGAPGVAGELADLSVERTPVGDTRRAARALAAAEYWYVAGDLTTVRERVANLVPTLSGVQRARALLLDGLATWYLGTAREATGRLTQALVDAGDDPELAGNIHLFLSIFIDYDMEAAREHAVDAVALLRETHDRGHLAAALLEVFQISVLVGLDPPFELLDEGLRAELEGPMADRLTSPGIWWAGIGRLDLARDRFQAMLESDRAFGVYNGGGNLLTRLAEVELWADDWPLARKLATAAIDADLENGVHAEEMALRVLAMVDALEGRNDEAEAAATAAIERAERAGDALMAAAWLGVPALAAAGRTDHPAVVDATGRAARLHVEVGVVEPLRRDPAVERIEALARSGRLEEAEAELGEFERRNERVPKTWAAAVVARGRASLALGRGDPAAAVAATEVVSGTEPDGWSRFDLARVLLVRGEALRRTRARRAAAEALASARDMFTGLGAKHWARLATDELDRLGLTRSTSLALTPTETRVARLAGEGLSSKAVAAELGISPRTVETHLAAVYGKLGVSSRAELGRSMARLQDDQGP